MNFRIVFSKDYISIKKYVYCLYLSPSSVKKRHVGWVRQKKRLIIYNWNEGEEGEEGCGDVKDGVPAVEGSMK